jgi:quercetin dioxygenase-like cupin family protein
MTLRSQDIARAATVPIEVLDPGIKRQILGFGPDIMTVKVWFETGAVGAVHSHPHSQSTYVESGRFLYQLGDRQFEVEAGDGIYIAPDTLHGSTCLQAGVMLDNFSPVRADFLPNGDRP